MSTKAAHLYFAADHVGPDTPAHLYFAADYVGPARTGTGMTIERGKDTDGE